MRRRAELLTCSDDLINSKIVFGCIFYHLVSLVSPSQYLAFIEPQKQTIVVIIITSKEEEEEGRKKKCGEICHKMVMKDHKNPTVVELTTVAKAVTQPSAL